MDPPYTKVIGDLLSGAQRVTSRYGFTREKLGVTVKTLASEYPTRPKLNPKIGVLEGLFLVGETYSQEAVAAVAPKADLSLFTERGAYGPRIRGQVEALVRGLDRDPSSRQNTLFIGRPGDQYTSDMPCTIALNFLIRQGSVDCFAFMRSSDVLKGLPTDIIQFGVLTQVLAHCFDYKARYVYVMAASHHLYLNDLEGRTPEDDTPGQFVVQPMFTGTPLRRYWDFRQWAQDAIAAVPWPGGVPRGIVAR
jgi:hypothetical protein